MDPIIRPYEPEDAEALWSLKRGFELGLGANTGAENKADRYATKLTDEYKREYLEWVERCTAETPQTVTVADIGEQLEPDLEHESDLIGYVFVLPESYAYIWDASVLNELYVVPEARGTDVANALMRAGLDVAREQDLPLDRIVLDVDRVNDRAKAFYQRHGFEHWGEMLSHDLE